MKVLKEQRHGTEKTIAIRTVCTVPRKAHLHKFQTVFLQSSSDKNVNEVIDVGSNNSTTLGAAPIRASDTLALAAVVQVRAWFQCLSAVLQARKCWFYQTQTGQP